MAQCTEAFSREVTIRLLFPSPAFLAENGATGFVGAWTETGMDRRPPRLGGNSESITDMESTAAIRRIYLLCRYFRSRFIPVSDLHILQCSGAVPFYDGVLNGMTYSSKTSEHFQSIITYSCGTLWLADPR